MTSSQRTTAFQGAILSVAMRWTDRLVGLVSTMVLARLLVPGDFGLVAMAMIVVGLIDVLLDLGVSSALIQNATADKADFDTAWTLRLCQAVLAALIIAIGAPLAARYYGDPRVTDVLRIVALSVLVAGFENIGTVSFQKDMEFGRDFRFFVSKRILGTSVTIVLAFALRSYWALVLGTLSSRAIGVALSYAMHSFRPVFSLSRVRQIWSFSQWNMVSNVAAYMTLRLDQFVIGRRASATILGAYSVGDEIAALPTTEVLAPLGRVMYPAFVNARSDPEEFRRIVVLSFAVQTLIGIPAGVGVTLVAPEFVPLLLGSQWVIAVPFIQVLGFAGVITALAHSSNYALLALGRVRALSAFAVVRLVALLVVLVLAFPTADPLRVAQLRLGVALASLIGLQLMVAAIMPDLRPGRMLLAAWRPLVAAVAMIPVVHLAASLLASSSAPVLLAGKIVVGVLTYTIVAGALWLIAGRPAGAESYLLEKIRG